MLNLIKTNIVMRRIVVDRQKRRFLSSVDHKFQDSTTRTQRECVEVQFPYPGGNLRGKWWGPTDRRPILGLHGRQNNCGSFDTLAPLLPPHVGFLAIDVPGHGWSSHYPPGRCYNLFDLPVVIRSFVKKFQWQKVSLIAHSVGGVQSFLYSTIFPDEVDFLVAIDIIGPLLYNSSTASYAELIDQFLKYNEQVSKPEEPPSYTYEECVEMLVKASNNSITRERAPCILDRGLFPSKKAGNLFYFNRDPRLKVYPKFLEKELLTLAEKIKAPTLIFRALNGSVFKDVSFYEELLKNMKSSSQFFVETEVEGTHHIHLTTPERIVDSINSFVDRFDNADRSQKNNLIDEIFVKKYV